MPKLLHDLAHVPSIRWQSAAVLPGRVHFVRHVAKHMKIPTIKFDGVLEVSLQLIYASLRDIGPHAQRVREVADLDEIQCGLLRSAEASVAPADQWENRMGSSGFDNILFVAPPRTNSRKREWP